MLGKLRPLTPAAPVSPLMTLILAAACSEVAGLLWGGSLSVRARKLLNNADQHRPGVLQLLASVERACDGGFFATDNILTPWSETLANILHGTPGRDIVRRDLLRRARVVGY